MIIDFDMKEKLQKIIKDNDGFIAKDIKVLNNIYCLKPLTNSRESLEIISVLYGDFYPNSCMLTPVEMNEKGYKEKLEAILDYENKFGFTYWCIYDQKTNDAVGLFGFKKIEGVPIEEALDLTLMTKIGGVIKPLCEYMIEFLFENFDIKELRSKVFSYNTASQLLTVKIGLVDNGITKAPDNYVRDSYFLNYLLTRDRYNYIKRINNDKYKSLKISRKVPLKDLHSGARTLKDALESFKEEDKVSRLDHCQKLYDFVSKRYPRSYK